LKILYAKALLKDLEAVSLRSLQNYFIFYQIVAMARPHYHYPGVKVRVMVTLPAFLNSQSLSGLLR
jgi:hypothetical protein